MPSLPCKEGDIDALRNHHDPVRTKGRKVLKKILAHKLAARLNDRSMFYASLEGDVSLDPLVLGEKVWKVQVLNIVDAIDGRSTRNSKEWWRAIRHEMDVRLLGQNLGIFGTEQRVHRVNRKTITD